MSVFDDNLEKLPELKKFGSVKNNEFLKDIYERAQKWKLSDAQIYSAKRAWESVQKYGDKTPWEINVERIDDLDKVTYDIVSHNDFMLDLYGKSKERILSDKQASALEKAIHNELDQVDYSKEELKVFRNFVKRLSQCGAPGLTNSILSKIDNAGYVTKSDREKIYKFGHKYRKCLFGKVFR